MMKENNMEKDQAEEEGCHSHVRNIINQNKVRLWEPPFYDGSKADDDEMVTLSFNLEPSSEIPQDQILRSLYYLQKNALDKLASRQAHKDSGTIKLKIKYPRSLPSSSCNHLPATLEINSSSPSPVNELKAQLCSLLKLALEEIKLISGGKVLLEHEGSHLKPGSSVMVVPIQAVNLEELRRGLEQNEILQSSKNDAEILKDDDRLEIGDQSGKSLTLPKEEKKALIMAMSLHERAKVNLRKKDFSLALVFLLEAYAEYQSVPPSILNAVDNYGLLNLDIAWTYLNMEVLSELPQAEQRLSECQNCFNRIYGSGNNFQETHKHAKILLARLHLLQGVVAYHQGDLQLARQVLSQVNGEFKSLFVPHELIEELSALGYNESEARLALRNCDLNVPSAALHIDEKRRERKRINEEESRRKKKRKALGKTADGKGYVNLGYLNTMNGMGFPEKLSGLALRQSNNDMGAAIDMIQNQPEMLLLSAEEEEKKQKKKKKYKVSDDLIANVVAATGQEDIQLVRRALSKCEGNVDSAVQALLSKTELSSEEEEDEDKDIAEATKEFFEKKKRTDEAYSRLKDELGKEESEENHLDVTLEEETVILEKYMGYLSMSRAA
eukprot:TRINITY_DN389_c1_g12_i1.p1 TRINITY_DN389_c1_g12~~TRINITY_DN389_c1_g12_i1.p1  ORF type:complete len:611 (-),score=198.27 TRINITY_DN389_c1_g12_i1:56-1888(-)